MRLVYRAQDRVGERLVLRQDEAGLVQAALSSDHGFDADGALFRLAVEAVRIRLGYLFDPYVAVNASQVDALPHQITAVYGEMLPRQPLRFLLADDPGAGKTVMAGLLIKELMIRGDLERCLVVAPGSLVEQWQDELLEKFGLQFDILSREQVQLSATGNPFAERNQVILRLDMAARSEELKAKLEAAAPWDLVICDEAHRMSASHFGGEVKETQRYRLGRMLGLRTRNLLLMTATPHNGKEADFHLFMGLLDPDRFEGRPRGEAARVDVGDMMRRLTKEELYRFDGTKLFPERRAYTASYRLSPEEDSLYQAVTAYVREEMNRADRIADDGRRSSVGFALQILQRRLASSPAAIHKSLERRRQRLQERLEALRAGGRDPADGDAPFRLLEDDDEAPGAEVEAAEQEVVDRATTAATLLELEAEIAILRDLEQQALRVKLSGRDTKWQELESILDAPLVMDSQSLVRRKLLIFTEPRDTLEYLARKIVDRLGDPAAVAVIHGGVSRDARRAAIAAFNNDPTVRVMLANDAAGEGVNLQRGAHLMVNYDLPWNPNRLEQRFGRIHRIGQTEVCHVWNLCAANTREGEVYRRLLDKLEEARAALGGKVYDVLGELFEGQALKAMLVEAIRYGDRPETRAELFRRVEGAVDVAAIEALVAERKLTSEGLDPRVVSAIREEMERAQARRLQPHFIGGFFREAFAHLGGRCADRERGRFEVSRIPPALKRRAGEALNRVAIPDRYARATFDKELAKERPEAELLGPGHPLLDATIDLVLERHRDLLARGAVLVDEAGTDPRPRLLVGLEHALVDGRTGRGGMPQTVSRQLQFVFLYADGTTADAGPAPHLDCRPLADGERERLGGLLALPWVVEGVEGRAIGHAVASLVPRHLAEVRQRRLAEVAKVEREVRARLLREINHWDSRARRLREEMAEGKDQRVNVQNAEATAQRLEERLHRRLAELERERQITALVPTLRLVALVVPPDLVAAPGPGPARQEFSQDPDARAEVERLAMVAVMEAERALGRSPRDVSAQKCGYDIESRDPATGALWFIEVKGRAKGADSITLTANEILTALNVGERYVLAIVEVEQGFAARPTYVYGPAPLFGGQPVTGEVARTWRLDMLLKAGRPV